MENLEFIEKNTFSRKLNVTENENNVNEISITENLLTPKKTNKYSQIKFITKKKFYFRIEETNECKKKSTDNIISNEGRWSKEEHEKFLKGLVLYGINWKKVKTLIGTRTPVQVRSHAQKFFYKMKTCKDESLGIDFTSNSISNFRDMINQIKNNNSNYNIIDVFKYLTYKCDNLEKSRKKIIIKNNENIDFKRSELNNQSNIINLKEDGQNLDNNNLFFNLNNSINGQKRMKETQNINGNEPNDILNINIRNNLINTLQNLLIRSYYSNVFNFLLSDNLNSPNYDNSNDSNKLLIDYLISNIALNNLKIFNDNALLSLALQNNISNNINNINLIHNVNNNINLKDINYCNNINSINNYNSINNINNTNIINNIDKIEDNNNNENSLSINIDKKDNNKNDNEENKNDNININKNEFLFCPDKQFNKINDKKIKNKDENKNSNNNNISF